MTAAVRDLAEETGLIARGEDPSLGCVMHRTRPSGEKSLDFFFLVRHWQGKLENREPQRCAELRFFPPTHLHANTIPCVSEGSARRWPERRVWYDAIIVASPSFPSRRWIAL